MCCPATENGCRLEIGGTGRRVRQGDGDVVSPSVLSFSLEGVGVTATLEFALPMQRPGGSGYKVKLRSATALQRPVCHSGAVQSSPPGQP